MTQVPHRAANLGGTDVWQNAALLPKGASRFHAMPVSAAGQEAQLLVPVVMDAMHKSAAAQQAWEGHWQGVPTHLLLPWAAQMLSLLDQPEGSSFTPALKVQHRLTDPRPPFCIPTFLQRMPFHCAGKLYIRRHLPCNPVMLYV